MENSCRKALIVVDMQNDFCPGGALGVIDGDRIISDINKLLIDFLQEGCPLFFIRDWHPKNHCSFSENGGPWPVHCIADTEGAAFHKELFVPDQAVIVSKAFRPFPDVYSGFGNTDLARILKINGVTDVNICGLTTDYGVKATAFDAIEAGFKVRVYRKAVKALNISPHDGKDALESMKGNGVILV
jgi:nicotinamidase/pyrazinamidase